MKMKVYFYLKMLYKKITKILFIFILKMKKKKKYNQEIIENDKILEHYYPKRKITCFTEKRNNKKEVDLSIIIPLYNEEKFLNKCVDSFVNNKTKYKYEVILVNDGSKDNTQKIMKEYKNKYKNIIKTYSKKNGGISSARNMGLEHACGTYISFLDQDDFVAPDYIEKMLNVAYNKKADIVRCNTTDVNIENYKKIYTKKNKYVEIKGYMKEKILDYPSYVWGCIVHSDLIKNVQFPDGYWYEDMIWRFLVYRQSKMFVNLNENLHFRGNHLKQLSKIAWNKDEKRGLEHLYLIETLLEDNKKFKLKMDVYLYLDVLAECSNIMLHRIGKIDDEIKQQVFARVYRMISNLYRDEYNQYLNENWKLKSDIILSKRYDLWLLLKYI